MRYLLPLVWVLLCSAFYLPGVAPTLYKEGDTIPLFVNHLTPLLAGEKDLKTYVYLYDYYYNRFHFCQPEGGPKKQSELLGLVVFGDRIFLLPFELKMMENKTCQHLCLAQYSKTDAVFVNRAIRSGYQHNWLIDGLPAASVLREKSKTLKHYGTGFFLGAVDNNGMLHLNNHYEIYVEYHERSKGEYRVVGVSIKPFSVQRLFDLNKPQDFQCELLDGPVTFKQSESTNVEFLYSVFWVPLATAWATRWDKYLTVYDPKIQWFLLINFLLIVVCLSVVISHILVRALRADITRYNEIDLDDDLNGESGWKLVHGDVFRPPKQPLLFLVLVGSGIQLFLMCFVTLFFALFGLLSPSNRGALATIMFLLYALFGAAGAFVLGYLYKFFGGENWKLNLALTPLLVPGALFAQFLFLNFFLIYVNLSGAVPITTMFVIVFVWFVVLVPLLVVGSLLALKRPTLQAPVKTNQIPRQVPTQPWYLRTIPIMLILGIFPFGLIAVEMFFVLQLLWFNRIYYMFGFLFFCFVLMLATCLLMLVLMTYYLLCSENYRWHWRSMFIGGASAVYIFIHSLLMSLFLLGNLPSLVLYVGYSATLAALVFLCCGSVGVLALLVFVKTIYLQIKID